MIKRVVIWINSETAPAQRSIDKRLGSFLNCIFPHATTTRIEHSALRGFLGSAGPRMTCLDELALRTFSDPRFVRSFVFDTLEREIRGIAQDVIDEKSRRSVHCGTTPLAAGQPI